MRRGDYLAKIFEDVNFFKYYLAFFSAKFSSSSIELETTEDSKNELKKNNLMAFKYLYNKKDGEKLNISDIQSVAKMIQYDENDKGFRNTTVEVRGSKIPRSKPKDIYMRMYSLLDNYYNVWTPFNKDEESIEDIFFREAAFHMQFVIIHPFEDGNGRTARIITSVNLLKEGIIPGIISKEDKKEYCDLIESQDVGALANFLMKLSIKEQLIFDEMRKQFEEEIQSKKHK